MPLYQYECENCGLFEIRQKVKDKELTIDPICGCPCKKIIPTEISFELKGAGWYRDGYVTKEKK